MKTYFRSITAALLLVSLLPFSGCRTNHSSLQQNNMPAVQAHRGGAAEYPENTIPAMIHAVSEGVPVLELDLHITKDSQVVVSHDPFLSRQKIRKPDGSLIAPDEEAAYILYNMTFDSLKRYDAGSLCNADYPDRKQIRCRIPLVSELITCVEHYTRMHHLRPVTYNVEIKSWPDKDGIYSPDYRTFADLCMTQLLAKKLGDRLLVQCFDARTLNYLHASYPGVALSYLIEPEEGVDFETQLQRLDFTPSVISPHHELVDETFVRKARSRNCQIIPWTVDGEEETRRLARLGVDGIITNRPGIMMQWLGHTPR